MSSDKPQVFRFQVERRELGIQELVMTEDQFKRWFIANGGRLVGKKPLADNSANSAKTPTSKAKRPSDMPASRHENHRPKPVSIPTVTVMSGDAADDPLFATLTGSDIPIILAIDEPSGVVPTLLMPNVVTKLLTQDELNGTGK
jgi:hypothetical protein